MRRFVATADSSARTGGGAPLRALPGAGAGVGANTNGYFTIGDDEPNALDADPSATVCETAASSARRQGARGSSTTGRGTLPLPTRVAFSTKRVSREMRRESASPPDSPSISVDPCCA